MKKKERLGIIYKATNKINGKVYIGQTINGIVRRKQRHHSSALNKKSHLFNCKFAYAIRKYGIENFKWKILYSNIPQTKLDNLEIKTIAKYNSFDSGYNSTAGGKNIPKKAFAKGAKASILKRRPSAKLSDKDVKMLLKLHKYFNSKILSEIFKVSQRIIHNILHKKTYKDIKRPKNILSTIKMHRQINAYFHSISGANKNLKKQIKSIRVLSEEDIKEIRLLYATQLYSQAFLSDIFQASQYAVYCVVSRKSWKHIK